MTYRPQKKSNMPAVISFFGFLFSIISFYISSKIEYFLWVYQLCAVIFAICALQVFFKYVQSDYMYKADDTDLKIYKITGNKSLCVCSLSYEESLESVVCSKQYKRHKKNFPKYKLAVNYCKNIFPEEFSVYFFNFNGKITKLKFEPDETFTNYLNEKIKASLDYKHSSEEE